MTFRGDNRAQSTLIGFILLFGILVLAFAGYQAVIVPDQNAEVEFNHNQDAQNQMQDVRTAVLQSGATGTHQSAELQLGTSYPARLIALNPPPPTGTLETSSSDELEITIENVEPADDQLADYWDANPNARTFRTQPLTYRPSYNEHRNAPRTTLEHSVLYNRFEEGTVLPKSEQSVFANRQVSFVFLRGGYSRTASESVNVDARPMSGPPNRITMEGAGGDPITIQLETELSEETWENLLEDEVNVEIIDFDSDPDGPNQLTVELDENPTYSLRMAGVTTGSQSAEPEPAYITDVSGNGATIPVGSSVRLVAEARDELNNPYSGKVAEVDYSGPGNVEVIDEKSGEDGRVRYRYSAPNSIPGTSITEEVTIEFEDATEGHESVTFEVEVVESGAVENGFLGPLIAINFQTAQDSRPPGFLPDTGEPFSEQNGLEYGWTEDNTDTARGFNDRENTDEVEQINVTLNHFVDNPAEEYDSDVHPSWSIEIPNGVYEVDLTGGDPDFLDQEITITLDGGAAPLQFVDDDFDSEENEGTENFIRHQGTIEVTDGELIMQPPDGTYNPKINWIELRESDEEPEEEPANFEVDIQSTNSPVEQDGTLDVEVRTENTGGKTDTQEIRLEFDGDEVGSFELELEPDENSVDGLQYDVPPNQDPGEYTIVVRSDDDSDSGTVDVIEENSAFYEVTTLNAPESAEQGEEIEVDSTIENTGEEAGEQDIELRLGGNTAGTEGTDYEVLAVEENVVIDGGEGTQINFVATIPDNQETGEQEIGVYSEDDDRTDIIEIQQNPSFETLEADSETRGGSSNIQEVTFTWITSGDVDETSFETQDTVGNTIEEANPEPPEEGSVTLDGGNEDTLDLIAITSGPSGSETCTVQITGESSVNKSDFNCTSD